MLVDCYEREDVFAQVPELAAEIDPVLRKLDGLLDDDALYNRCERTLVNGIATPWYMGATPHPSKCCYAC
jgi:hypothetical protein